MRKFIGVLFIVILMGLLKPAPVGATVVTAYCNTVDPYDFSNTLSYNGQSESGGIGTIQFTLATSTNTVNNGAVPVNTNGVFYTYCVDLIQNVYLNGGPYQFTVTQLADAPQSGAYLAPQSGPMGSRIASEINTLYQEHYSDTTPNGGNSSSSLQEDKQAFQLAIWNLLYDNDKNGINDASVSPNQGIFYEASGSALTDGAVGLANTWLGQATSWTPISGDLDSGQQSFTGGHLYSLVGANDTQDQIGIFQNVVPDAVAPLPSVAGTGFILLAGVAGFAFIRRRQVTVA